MVGEQIDGGVDRIGEGVDVGDDGDFGSCVGERFEELAELPLGFEHVTRVERPADIQGDEHGCAGGFEDRFGAQDLIAGARDDDLGWGVEVGEVDGGEALLSENRLDL